MRLVKANLARWILVTCMAAPLAAPGQDSSPVEKPAAEPAAAEVGAEAVVQLAILLDTSSSMGGLIHQAQTQLWKIVNEFALARLNGRPVALKVALYEYGKNTLPRAENFIRKILPLTDNLDRASEELFALKANTIAGGDEYCGTVILRAAEDLQWSPSNGDLKVIVIAGNEPFTQGPVDYRKACRTAISRGILVNTIHCGNYSTGVSTGWKDGALLADGVYCCIDQNRAVTRVAAPQDEKLRELGKKLNDTYLPYGDLGGMGAARQEAQDRNAEDAGGESGAQRAISKGSGLYKNSAWDLVDAVKEGKLKLESIKKEDLPEEMRELSLQEKKAYLEKKASQRMKIQTEIQQLNEERRKFLVRDGAPAAAPAAKRAARSGGRPGEPAGEARQAGAAPEESRGEAVEAARAVDKSRRGSVTADSAISGRKSTGTDGKETLDEAMIKILRKQAKKKGITLK